MAKRGRPKANAGRRPTDLPAELVDSPSRRIQAARSLWNSGMHADALSLLAEAVRQEPNNVRAYVSAARAYGQAFEFDAMERLHELLIERGPRHPGVHHYLGETFGLLKLPERAIACYEFASRLPGAAGPTWMELASWYERSHRLEEAEALIERTIRSGFDLPLVSLVRGRIQRRQKRPEAAEATLHSLIDRLPADSEWACRAWGELALMKDAAGDFDGAVEAIEHCKYSQRSREASCWASSQRIHRPINELLESVSRHDFRRWRDEAAELMPRRVALLTGFPRSGTTLLEQLLDAHPEVVSSEERDYLGQAFLHAMIAGRGKTPLLEILNERGVGELESHRQRYVAAMEYLLGESLGERLHLDKNPSYILMIPLMLRLFPEARLIVALRDPRDVVLSCYLRYLPLNAVSVWFMDIGRTAEKYALDMAAWLRLREQMAAPWCEIRYEDTVTDVAGQARAALTALGLPWDDQVLDYRRRLSATKQVNSPSYEAVAQPIYRRSVGRWRNYERLMEPALEVLAPFVREFGYEQ